MTATNIADRTTKDRDAVTTTARLSLAELLKRSMEEDPTSEEPVVERWDDDEGSSGGVMVTRKVARAPLADRGM